MVLKKNNNIKTGKQLKDILVEKKRIETQLLGDWAKLQKSNQVIDNQKRDFEPQGLYNCILINEQHLLRLKLSIVAANSGFKSLAELPRDCNYVTIYKLSNLELRKKKFEELLKSCRNEVVNTSTIKNIHFQSIFTKEIIYTHIQATQVEIDQCKTILQEFNNTIFEINDLPF